MGVSVQHPGPNVLPQRPPAVLKPGVLIPEQVGGQLAELHEARPLCDRGEVIGHGVSLAGPAQHAPGVARVGHVQLAEDEDGHKDGATARHVVDLLLVSNLLVRVPEGGLQRPDHEALFGDGPGEPLGAALLAHQLRGHALESALHRGPEVVAGGHRTSGPGVTIEHREDCVLDLVQLPAHQHAQAPLPSHGLILVVTRLAGVDGLRVAGAPGEGGHVPGHNDGPHLVVSCHLDLILGLQLEKVRSLVLILFPTRFAGKVTDWKLPEINFVNSSHLDVCAGDGCLIPLTTESSSRPPMALYTELLKRANIVI